MKAIDAVRECWDGEKGAWKDGWRVKCGTSSCPPRCLEPYEFVDGSDWEVVPPKVTLREAMVALLKGEVQEARRGDCSFTFESKLGLLNETEIDHAIIERILAGIDPDDGPAEWELVG